MTPLPRKIISCYNGKILGRSASSRCRPLIDFFKTLMEKHIYDNKNLINKDILRFCPSDTTKPDNGKK